MRLVCCLAILLFSFGARAQTAVSLGITADEPAPTIGRLLVERLPPAFQLELRPFPDVTSMLDAIKAGEIDLAFLEEPLATIPDISVVGELYPSVLHVLAKGPMPGGDLGSLLAAGPIWAGAPGSTGHRLASQLASDYGIKDIELLPDPWTEEPSVYFIFGGLLGGDALSRLDGFSLYSVGDPTGVRGGSVAEGVVLRYPNLRAFLLPAEVYPGLSREPVLTLAVKTLLVARQGLEPDDVYELAMALSRLKPAIAAAYPLAGIGELGRSQQAPRALPWHPGAQRYIDRELPSFIERYAEFMGAAATITIALVSLGVAYYRRRRQARKDRLDTYYQQALACRVDMGSAQADPREMAGRLRALQADVFALLVAERIDADSALVAFLALSNQLLHEAEAASLQTGPGQLNTKPS